MPTSSAVPSISIIGAGLSSLSLTLTLLHVSFLSASNITIYESRSFTSYTHAPENESGVILTPNGLRILDEIGVFGRIREQCWTSEHRTFVDREGKVKRKVRVAWEEVYGYCNHRLWRRVLQECMRGMVEERGVGIRYGSRFEGVVEEGEKGVVFVVNGERCEAGMLVGADGIYSRVRQYIAPGVEPEYMGTCGVLGHICYDAVEWPDGFVEKHFTVQDGPASLFMIPEDKQGVEGMVGLQKEMKGLVREQWEELGRDGEKLCEFYREAYGEYGELSRKIIDAVCANKERLYAWPFLKMPRMKKWFSEKGRVVILGDAAHAIPPSSSQGVNQALEDVWTLTALLVSGTDLPKSLQFWQDLRQHRIDDVLEQGMAKANVQRLPEKEREKLMSEGKLKEEVDSGRFDDMLWLFKPDLDRKVEEWLLQQTTAG